MSYKLAYTAKRKSDEPITLRMLWKAQSKERPRAAKGGHFYTPPKTVKFERMVRDAAKFVDAKPYTCPVSVDVVITEPVPKSFPKWKREAAELGLLCPPVGDLDNKIKAITDALNGLAYIDDKQISHMSGVKQYGDEHYIFVRIARSGLSLAEVEAIRNGRRHRQSRARVG